MLFTAKIDSQNQLTLPPEVRKQLGVGPGDTIAFVVDDEGNVRIKSAKKLSVSDLFGAFPALPGASADLRRELDEAMSAQADEIIYGRRHPKSVEGDE